jgi:hypothetical protein
MRDELTATLTSLFLSVMPGAAHASDIVLMSTNSGDVGAFGSFTGAEDGDAILGGRRNAIAVTATGASIELGWRQIDGRDDPIGALLLSSNDGWVGTSFVVVRNNGAVIAGGSFAGMTMSGEGQANAIAVRASGASLSIDARSD